MKQYVVMYQGMSIEHTGYFKSVAAVRKYLKARYAGNGFGLRFRAVYPTLGDKIYTV